MNSFKDGTDPSPNDQATRLVAKQPATPDWDEDVGPTRAFPGGKGAKLDWDEGVGPTRAFPGGKSADPDGMGPTRAFPGGLPHDFDDDLPLAGVPMRTRPSRTRIPAAAFDTGPVSLTVPEKPKDAPTALVVVDTALDAFEASEHLAAVGYDVIQAAAGKEALVRLKEEAPDLVYLDCWYSGMDTLSFLRLGHKVRPTLASITIVCLPEDPDTELVDLVEEADVAAVLPKPWSADTLDEAIVRARLPELPESALGSERSFLELEAALRPDGTILTPIEIEAVSRPKLEAALPEGVLIDGRYKIDRFLGRGATSNVYAVRDRELGETVALKLLTTTMDSSPMARERFRQEMRICRSIAHPAVVRAFEFGTHEGRLYFTMELLEGEPLRRLLLRNRWEPVPVKLGLRWLRQSCSGLHAAHRLGVVHRDIKPENLFLIRGSNEVKITDFGIARMPEGNAAASIEGMVLGTPAYLSPEQITGSGPTTPRSDIYSMGVVAWELLAGRHPFFRKDQAELMQAIAREEAPRLRTTNKKVPRKVDQLVHRMLSKEPGRRPASAGEVVAELDRL
jgi:CheY-like chemotaxis protein